MPDINRWAQTVQTVVTAIRNAGCVERKTFVTTNGLITSISTHRATTNLLLLPGNSFTSAAAFVPGGSAAALNKVTNPDGSKDNIVFDVHKYSDSDNSGTHTECTSNGINDAFRPLAEWLRCHGRQAFNTEMGGGNTASCINYICQQVEFMNENSDGTYPLSRLGFGLVDLVTVYLGYVGWGAGSFNRSYELTSTPIYQNGHWNDTSLLSCLKNSSTLTSPNPPSASGSGQSSSGGALGVAAGKLLTGAVVAVVGLAIFL